MEPIIILPNRYRNKNYLRLIPDTTNKYELVFSEDSNYYSVSKDEKGDILFIDPEGGPMISVGSVFGGGTLTKITEDLENNRYVLTF